MRVMRAPMWPGATSVSGTETTSVIGEVGLDGGQDVLVAGAAAQDAGELLLELLALELQSPLSERDRGQDEGGCAVAALKPMRLLERALGGVELLAVERLDGRDLGPVGLGGEHDAGLDRLAVEQHGAHPA